MQLYLSLVLSSHPADEPLWWSAAYITNNLYSMANQVKFSNKSDKCNHRKNTMHPLSHAEISPAVIKLEDAGTVTTWYQKEKLVALDVETSLKQNAENAPQKWFPYGVLLAYDQGREGKTTYLLRSDARIIFCSLGDNYKRPKSKCAV